MSLMRLLAAGRSIMGIRKQPGPYRMRQDNLLPKFQPVEKPVGVSGSGKRPEPTDESDSSAPPKVDAQPALAPIESASVLVPESKAPRAGGIFARLKTRWIRRPRRSSRGAMGKRAGGRQIQAELSLDLVKVVRNDLTDSDFELMGGQGARLRSKNSQRQGLGMVWNRLSARLLRQAALEFNLVQKERGKLLSQAGHDSGGARGA